MAADGELWRLTATQAVDLLSKREVSPVELVHASAARIAETDSHLNALPTLCVERAVEHATRIASEASGTERPRGWLGGLPIVVKDLVPVEGVRTTWGSPIYADHLPPRSDILVETLEARGAVVMGKSNTPEFGAGANTFNEVFGTTRNPWDVATTCGGSSGGSAAALAAGQVWLATGSDLGGSLRIPASYCSVVGFRPSPGRVARGPHRLLFETLMVDGPMARTAEDVALFLDAMAGTHPEDPLSFDAPAESFREAMRALRPRRAAYSADLGFLPVDREVAAVCRRAAEALEGRGVTVEDAPFDLTGALETFQTLRAALFAADKAELLETHRDRLKPDVVWNIEKGLALGADDIGRAERERSVLYQRTVLFLERHGLLLCPAVMVPPFDAEIRWVQEVEGHRFDNYVDWLGFTLVLTLTGCPSASVPAGFTASGLPVGLQILGPPRAEAEVLAAAAAVEEAVALPHTTPIDPRDSEGRSLPLGK